MKQLKFIYDIYEWYISRNLKSENLPKHIAIIMDGNRRYTKVMGNMEVIDGHKKGVSTLEKVLDWSIELEIEIVTVYAFSTENFKRPPKEVEGLMKLFQKYFEDVSKNPKIDINDVRI